MIDPLTILAFVKVAQLAITTISDMSSGKEPSQEELKRRWDVMRDHVERAESAWDQAVRRRSGQVDP